MSIGLICTISYGNGYPLADRYVEKGDKTSAFSISLVVATKVTNFRGFLLFVMQYSQPPQLAEHSMIFKTNRLLYKSHPDNDVIYRVVLLLITGKDVIKINSS